MVKIIFSDFDDTMLHYYSEKNSFDHYQLDVLRKLKEKGIYFCIVTGRCVSFFYQFPELLKVIDYILASNGGCIYDVRKKKFIFWKFIEQDNLKKIVQYAKMHEAKFLLNSLDKRYQYGDWSNGVNDLYQEDVLYSCEQVVLASKQVNLDDCCQYLSSLQEIVVNNVTFWDDECSMDINDVSISKGSSVLWLCQYLNIDVKGTLAFGDGENDISMFQVVEKGIAVGNACDILKQNSYDVSLNCGDNGIYKYLEDNILNG